MFKSKRDFAKGFSLALTMVFFLAEAFTAAVGVKYPALDLTKIDIVSPEQLSTTSTEAINIDDELDKLQVEVSPLIENVDDDLQKALIVKEWVMNQASGCGFGITALTPYATLAEMREGKSAACGNMSWVYWGALKSLDMEARIVILVRSVYERDTHAVVEVFINDEWMVIDPSFNTYYLINGKPASAADLRELFLSNERQKNLEVIEGSKVLYPVKYDAYPIDPISFYNHVFVFKHNFAGVWQRIPLLHYYFGNSYMMAAEGKSHLLGEVKIHNFRVLAYDLIYPIGFGISFLSLMASLFVFKKRKTR